MAGCGEAGRLAYQNLQLADLFYPTVTGIFQTAVLAMALTHILERDSRWLSLAALPLVGAGFDYLENVAAWTALYTFPTVSKTATVLLGVASPAKQSVSWAAGVLLLVALAYVAVRWVMARRRPFA